MKAGPELGHPWSPPGKAQRNKCETHPMGIPGRTAPDKGLVSQTSSKPGWALLPSNFTGRSLVVNGRQYLRCRPMKWWSWTPNLAPDATPALGCALFLPEAKWRGRTVRCDFTASLRFVLTASSTRHPRSSPGCTSQKVQGQGLGWDTECSAPFPDGSQGTGSACYSLLSGAPQTQCLASADS